MLNALHEVWLAGLGAVVKAQRGAPKLLEDLIAEGARFQEDTQGTAQRTLRRLVGDAQARFMSGVGQARGQAGEAFDSLEKVFQTRVQRVLGQLGVPSAHELELLGRRVDALTRSVQQLGRRAPARKRAAAGRAGARTRTRRVPAHAVRHSAPPPAGP